MTKKQFIINKKNIAQYLKSQKTSLKISKVNQIKEVIKNSGSCFIFKATIKANNKWQSIVIKQAQDFLKIDPSFKLSPKRLKWEYEALKYFSSISKKKVLPKVLWYDDRNYILVLTNIQGSTGKLLREEIEKGKLHPEIMKNFAELLAEWHLLSYNKKVNLGIKSDKQFTKEWSSYLKNEIINDFYTVGARKITVNSIVDELLEESKQTPSAIIWLDPLPKNIFVDKGKFKLIDFETAVNWDIAWDAAIFISDWVIELSNVDKGIVVNAKKCVRLFLDTYIKRISLHLSETELLAMKKRIYRYLGIFLLHRTNGVDNYKFEKQRYLRIQTEALRLIQELYANDFAKDLVALLNINHDFVQEEISFKSKEYTLKGILQIPKIKSNKRIAVVIYIHGGTDRGMLGSPAIFEISDILLKQGIALFRFNLIGTDNSDGLLCDKTWERLEDNFHQAIKIIKKDKRFCDIGLIGRSYGATLIAANADQKDIQAMVLQNPIFDEWYEFIHLLPEMTKDFIKNPHQKFLILGKEKKEHIKGDYKFSSEIIKQFPIEKWRMMQSLSKSNNICIIQAENDPETTPEHARIIYNMTQQPKEFHIIKDTVHKFPNKEKEVANITAKWLISHLKE